MYDEMPNPDNKHVEVWFEGPKATYKGQLVVRYLAKSKSRINIESGPGVNMYDNLRTRNGEVCPVLTPESWLRGLRGHEVVSTREVECCGVSVNQALDNGTVVLPHPKYTFSGYVAVPAEKLIKIRYRSRGLADVPSNVEEYRFREDLSLSADTSPPASTALPTLCSNCGDNIEDLIEEDDEQYCSLKCLEEDQ